MNQETKQKRLGEQIVGVFGWVRERWFSILVVILLLFLIVITCETARLGNLGFDGYTDAKGEYHRGKTYWDWMELLIIPIVLAVGAWWLNKSERENEREIADKRREDDRRIAEDTRNQATLEAYFDRMTELLLEKGLRESQDDEVRSIARTWTLAVLRSLDDNRKGQVVQFLYESGLIGRELAVVSLYEADLRGADLRETDLFGVKLSDAKLRGADLTRADLCWADLSGADLSASKLRGADLRAAHLGMANLRGADLRGVHLGEVHVDKDDLRDRVRLGRVYLSDADLRAAHLGADETGEIYLSMIKLREANLRAAHLGMADLRGAKVTAEQLAQAASLAGATLPDGTKVPDEEMAGEQG